MGPDEAAGFLAELANRDAVEVGIKIKKAQATSHTDKLTLVVWVSLSYRCIPCSAPIRGLNHV